MKNQSNACYFRLVGIRLTITLATLGLVAAAQSADARHPSGKNSADNRIVQNQRMNDSPVNRGNATPPARFTPPQRSFTPPTHVNPPQRTFAAPQTVFQHKAPRFQPNETPARTVRQPPPVNFTERSQRVATPNRFILADDNGRGNRGGAVLGTNNNLGMKAGGNRDNTVALPARQIIPHDIQKPLHQGTVIKPAVPKFELPPPSGNAVNRSRTVEVQKRLDTKGTATDSGGFRQGGGRDFGRKPGSVGTITNIAPSLPVQNDRTKPSDVHRRLGGPIAIPDRHGPNALPKWQDLTDKKRISPAVPDTHRRAPPNVYTPHHDKVTREAMKVRFGDQLKAGDFDRLTAGETARKLKLADQYRMYQQGDVARRLGLDNHADHGNHAKHPRDIDRFHKGANNHPFYEHHPDFHHGLVNPAYARHCMPYHYWGPKFFAGTCWYPRWNPWVEWSWNYRCYSVWDPRPIWCRPIYYDPCPQWTYWDTPEWTPLPTVSSGTWVDLRPVAIEATEADLQLVAVRFVDPGHPEEKLGPRYRVWFRNNSTQPIATPFNVMLFAANDDRVTDDLPQAGVRVSTIEADTMQSVDIRLPVDAYTMNHDANGAPVPFAMLHVLVDANREVLETTKTNNGIHLPPAEVLPVDPAAFELEPTTAKPVAEVVLAGEGFGPEPGQILLHIDGKEVEGEILGWYDLGVRWTLPAMVITNPIEAEVVIVRGDGAASNPLKIIITP